jgi:hypothetical protein
MNETETGQKRVEIAYVAFGRDNRLVPKRKTVTTKALARTLEKLREGGSPPESPRSAWAPAAALFRGHPWSRCYSYTVKMADDIQQISKTARAVPACKISKTARAAPACKGDRAEWFGRPGDRRFYKRTTVRAARRHGKAVVRGADLG